MKLIKCGAISVAGVKFHCDVALLRTMKPGHLVQLIREPENKFDPHAIALSYDGKEIGYIPAKLSIHFSPLLDSGQQFTGAIRKVSPEKLEIIMELLFISNKEDD